MVDLVLKNVLCYTETTKVAMRMHAEMSNVDFHESKIETLDMVVGVLSFKYFHNFCVDYL
jgi:hypothetical protein